MIDENKLKEQLFALVEQIGDERLHIDAVVHLIDDAPAVDAVPVRYGRWETDGMMMDDGEYLMTRCTACGEAYEYGYNMPFCPNCGAKMDGKGDGNETD